MRSEAELRAEVEQLRKESMRLGSEQGLLYRILDMARPVVRGVGTIKQHMDLRDAIEEFDQWLKKKQ